VEQKRKIVPPVWVLLTLLASVALHHWLPLWQLVRAPWSYGGAVLIVLGVLLGAPAVLAFRRAQTPLVPFERSTALVTGGPFRFTRNPMYSGMVLMVLGVATLLGSLGAYLPIPLFVWIIQKNFIEGEERFLTELFGEQYLAYQRRVRRWI
jgi:protein-S-isoprenylcysteine O-methyltransferase Ste14